MFLKRRIKIKQSLLYSRFFIDVWGYKFKKRKLKNRRAKKFLEFFIRYLKRWFIKRPISLMLKRKKAMLKRQWHNKPYTKSIKRKNLHIIRSLRKNQKSLKKIILLPTVKNQKDQKIILSSLYKQKKISTAHKKFVLKCLLNLTFFNKLPRVTLIRKWKYRLKKDLSSFIHLSRWWQGRRVPFYKYTYLRRPKSYIITRGLDRILQQYHFGFGTQASLRAYVRRYAHKEFLSHYGYLGIEGMLANLLCRLTLFPEIRTAYAFIRSGAFLVDNVKTNNPRKMIRLGSTISVSSEFRKVILKYYLLWVKQKRVLVGIPFYFDYDFKLMKFRIWRKITESEQKKIGYYPLKKLLITKLEEVDTARVWKKR